MNVKSVEKEATRASVTVELTREELEPALNRAYLKYRKDIMIPGFRKGHAPRMVIEAMASMSSLRTLSRICSRISTRMPS